MRLPLRKLIALDSPMLLRNAFSVYTIFVPTSARLKFKSCSLNLDFTNSIALLSDRSVLRVVMNDVIVAQFRLDRNKPFNSAEVSIPTELLKTGFNRLQFIVSQHYANQCEDPGAPELFTEINPDTSYLSAVAEWRDVPQRLSYLRWWVDEKLWAPYQFNVCFPGSGQMTDLQLAWGGIVTQGVALALNYQPFRVTAANALRAGMDNIVVGTMSELSGYLTATEIGSVNGSFLAIKTLPGDPTHCMIIISGRDEREVGQTALAFGLVNYPLPDSQYAIVDQLTLPQEPAFIRNAPMQMPASTASASSVTSSRPFAAGTPVATRSRSTCRETSRRMTAPTPNCACTLSMGRLSATTRSSTSSSMASSRSPSDCATRMARCTPTTGFTCR